MSKNSAKKSKTSLSLLDFAKKDDSTPPSFYESLQKKFDGFYFDNGKIFCLHCKNSKATNCNDAWTVAGIPCIDSSRNSYLKIYKKSEKHFNSKIHLKIVEEKRSAAQEPLKAFITKLNEKQIPTTEKLITLAYFISIHNRPFTDFPKLVDLAKALGIDMGISCQSERSCRRMIEIIAKRMRSQLFKKIVDSGSKISIIVDESDTISKETCLSLYLNTFVDDKVHSIFVELIEIKERDSRSIFNEIVNSIKKIGFTDLQIRERLIQFVSDGASTFTGKKTGVGALFKDKIPNIVLWHCLAHRLELSISDVRKSNEAIIEFQNIFQQIYNTYSRSSKNVNAIRQISEDLNVVFKKIGKLFTIRWSSSSFKAVDSIIQNFEALSIHMHSQNSEIYHVFQDLNFVNNILNIKEILFHVSILSQQLQNRHINIVDANNLIINCVHKLKKLATIENQQVSEVMKTKEFKGIKLSKKKCVLLNREKFFMDVAEKIFERSLASVYRSNMENDQKIESRSEYFELYSISKISDKKHWSSNQNELFSLRIIKLAAKIFSLNEMKLIEEFEIYRDTDIEISNLPIYYSFSKCVQTIVITSAEVERCFSKMNLIKTKLRNMMCIRSLNDLLFISTIAMPLNHFSAKKYAADWLAYHQSADSTRNVSKNEEIETCYYDDLFKFFQ